MSFVHETPSSTPVAILAGGLGKRLRAELDGRPKSLAPVAGRPFLDYLLAWLRATGFHEVILCVGHKRRQIRRRYARGHNSGLRIVYSIEKRTLGTAGAVRHAARLIRHGTFLVVNGDSFFDVDPAALIAFHRRRRALVTMALAPAPGGARYGTVRAAHSGKILKFVEKETARSRHSWINAGVYVFDRSVVSRIPAGREVSLEREVFPRLIGERFYGYPARGYFIDIGMPEDFARAQKEFHDRFAP